MIVVVVVVVANHEQHEGRCLARILQWPDHRLVGSRQEMGRAQMPLWVQLRRREIERQGEEEVTASLQLTRRRHRLGSAVSS